MASHVVVIDSTLRRTSIKVTPQTHLSDILEQACAKLNLRSEQYGIRHNKKPLDLSLTYRLSGLPPGAQLELVQVSRSPSIVDIALQLPNNQRITDKFPSSTSLWQVLRRFESGVAGGTASSNPINITQRGIAETKDGKATGMGRLIYEMPVIDVANRRLASFVDLQKTLAQIGITSGKSLLRLHYKNEGTPLEEAMAQISEYFKATPDAPLVTLETPGENVPDAGAPQSTDEPEKATEITRPESSEPMENVVISPPASSTVTSAYGAQQTEEILTPLSNSDGAADVSMTLEPEPSASAPTAASSLVEGTKAFRHSITVYTPPSADTPAAAAQPFIEADYVPTVDHAKYHQSRLNQSGRNQRLLSDAELAKQRDEKQAQIAQVQNIKVRVRLPDQSMIENTFGREDTAADLIGIVRLALRHPEQPFILRHTDSKGKHVPLAENSQTLINDLGWRGATQVYMIWSDEVPAEVKEAASLNDEHVKQAMPLKVEEVADQEVEKQNKGVFGGILSKGKAKMSSEDKEKKLKNIFGLGKKR